jgi:trigger factor
MAGYTTRKEIMDRVIADGDIVNIDYDGKIDGIVFEGGSTMSVGVDVTISAADDTDSAQRFLDSLLYQRVGHMPGESIDIEITFPADYRDETLRGKDAVYTTTINYIVEREELTDDYVANNLSSSSGWTTVEEMESGMRASIQSDQVKEYVYEFLRTEGQVKSIPDSLMKYQKEKLMNEYQEYADNYGLELEEYLKEYVDLSSVEELLEKERDFIVDEATYLLVVQAVAEEVRISVSDEDLTTYFTEHFWSSDYSHFVEQYGMPFVKQMVLSQKVIDYIAENAVLL